MTQKARCLLEAIAAAFFAVSTLIFTARTAADSTAGLAEAGAPGGQFASVVRMSEDPDRLPRLLDLLSHPIDPIIGTLLLATITAALFRSLSLISRNDCPPVSIAACLGLVLAGIWPWLDARVPAISPLVAILAAAGTVAGVVLSGSGRNWRAPFTAAFIAGWLLIVGALAGASYLQPLIGAERAMLAALLATALIGTRVQLQIGGTIGFSLALIWAMIGISAATVSISITIATACVLGISALAVALVRVTT